MRQMTDIGMVAVLDGGGKEVGEDLRVTAGDFVMAESTYQHQRQLLQDNVGEFKENPTICVGAVNYLDDEGAGELIRVIAQQFMQDGMEVKQLNPNPVSIADSTAKPFENAFYI